MAAQDKSGTFENTQSDKGFKYSRGDQIKVLFYFTSELCF